jgi:hypothetical protein
MIRYLVAGMQHAIGLHRPGRRLPVRPDDILLASYPTSGNTWTRFLLANLAHPDLEVGFGNVHRLVLDPEVTVQRDFDRAPRPRIIKTHSGFDPRYRRVIYLVCDPRDVALSQYQSLRREGRIGDEYPMADFIERFLTGEFTRDLGSWGESVGSWLATRCGDPGFLLLRYEDLLADTPRELTRVADFAGMPATPERISQAVERSGRQEIPFVSSAKSGGWRSHLPEPQAARIEAAWGGVMACIGYELATRTARNALESSLLGLLAAGVASGTGERREETFAGEIPTLPRALPKQTVIR